MKCTKCGAWSNVLATREAHDGLVTRRERKCANDHRFTSYEVHGTMWAHLRSRVLRTGETIRRRWKLWARNMEIRRKVISGVPQKEVAAQYNLTPSSIHLICKEPK